MSTVRGGFTGSTGPISLDMLMASVGAQRSDLAPPPPQPHGHRPPRCLAGGTPSTGRVALEKVVRLAVVEFGASRDGLTVRGDQGSP